MSLLILQTPGGQSVCGTPFLGGEDKVGAGGRSEAVSECGLRMRGGESQARAEGAAAHGQS